MEEMLKKPVNDGNSGDGRLMKAIPGSSGLTISSVKRKDEFTPVASKVTLNAHIIFISSFKKVVRF